MAVTSAQYTVTTSPTKIVSADIAAEMVYIHSETAVAYLGDSTVSSTTGVVSSVISYPFFNSCVTGTVGH